jgi:hypothetical protein
VNVSQTDTDQITEAVHEQTPEQALLNGIATRCKDANSFMGKLQRALADLRRYVEMINLQRVQVLQQRLQEGGRYISLAEILDWEAGFTNATMQEMHIPGLVKLVVAEDGVYITGDDVPSEPIDPGVVR